MNRERLLDSLIKKIQTKEWQTIGIYGHGGSGKTTFAKALCERLDLTKVNLLETDLGAGTLYGALNSLQDKKWIEPYGDSEGRKKNTTLQHREKKLQKKSLQD